MVPGYSGGTAPAFHRLPFSFVEDEHPVSFVEGYYTDEKRTCKRLRKKNPLSPWADLNPKVSWGSRALGSGHPACAIPSPKIGGVWEGVDVARIERGETRQLKDFQRPNPHRGFPMI